MATIYKKIIFDTTSRKVAGSIPVNVIGGVDSASNRNEYQEYFVGVKVGGA